ncbi:MAG: T9SS type A sorting domain-containing protein [Saprospiraceae bacterium]|nr:T9SS type A sorting domain-containing protein [Saprospiraceae bacterium]
MKKVFFATIFTASVLVLNAQQFEIRILERGTQAHVQMRSISEDAPTTKQQFTDIVFGVIWTNRQITGLNIASTDYGITKSGTVEEHRGFYYQAFGAMGTPRSAPFDWESDQWVDIAVLDVQGGAHWGFYFQKQLGLARTGYHMTTEPNVGFQLVDETPRVLNYDFSYHLKDFDAQPHEAQSAVINWNAEEHELLDHYIVERSIDGKSWHQVGYVDRDERNPYYEYLDTNLEGVRNGVFYRLRIEDKFGGFTYSDRDFVPFKVSVEIYPNPSVDGLHITIDKTGIVKPDQLVIYDVQGRLIYRQDIPAESYQEYIDYSKTGLEGGAYILEMRKDDEVFWNEKFEIMNKS